MSSLSEELPESFEFAGQVFATEVVDLRDYSQWGTEKNPELWRTVIDQSIATTGVRNADHELIGVGFLAGNLRHAVLCDFVVRPDYRSIGIGTAILNRRINIADGLNIPYLYTELAPTNRLRQRYVDLGFTANGHAYTRAARRHPSELETH
jgi:GNAT superfamily N-acetyltransferase